MLVTGASGGIGLATSKRLVAAGAQVVMVARTRATLEEAARQAGGHALPADVTDAADAGRLATELHRQTGRDAPDILVNAAGAFALAPLVRTTIEEFDRQIAANLRAPFVMIRMFLPMMLARGSGHIVTIGSIAGRQVFPLNGAYSASKYGVRGLHGVLDAELKGTGVRSTLIEPAATDTSLWDAIDRTVHVDLPGRESMLSAAEVAEAVLFAVTRPPETRVREIFLERT